MRRAVQWFCTYIDNATAATMPHWWRRRRPSSESPAQLHHQSCPGVETAVLKFQIFKKIWKHWISKPQIGRSARGSMCNAGGSCGRPFSPSKSAAFKKAFSVTRWTSFRWSLVAFLSFIFLYIFLQKKEDLPGDVIRKSGPPLWY